MSVLSIVTAVVDAHSVLGAVVGAVAAVSSQKVYAFVQKQTALAKAAVTAEADKVKAAAAAEIKKV
jgi:hypothetical protein